MGGLINSACPMAKWSLLLVHLFLASAVSAQCDGQRYRYRMFEEVEVTSDVLYGSNMGSGSMKSWRRLPLQETRTQAVLWSLAHGGFFAGSKGTDVLLRGRPEWATSPCPSHTFWHRRLVQLECLYGSGDAGVRDAGRHPAFAKSHAEKATMGHRPEPRGVKGLHEAFIALHRRTSTTWTKCPTPSLFQPGLGGLEGVSARYSSEVLSIVNLCAPWATRMDEVGDAPW